MVSEVEVSTGVEVVTTAEEVVMVVMVGVTGAEVVMEVVILVEKVVTMEGAGVIIEEDSIMVWTIK